MKCIYCDSLNLSIRHNGPHAELFCIDCLKFQKFLSRKDVKRLEEIFNKKTVNSKHMEIIKEYIPGQRIDMNEVIIKINEIIQRLNALGDK